MRSLLLALSLSGCCFAANSPEPCHPHDAQEMTFQVTGDCGAGGVLRLQSPAGSVCDFTTDGAALGLPGEGSLYGAGTAPLVEGQWFLGWAPRPPMPPDADYRQCRTVEAASGIDLVCEDRRRGTVLREVCRAHLEPIPETAPAPG